MAKINLSEIRQPIRNEQNHILWILGVLSIPFLLLCALLSRKLCKAIYQAEEETNSIVEAAGDAILLIDKECNIIEINKATEEILGYSKNNILGKPVVNLALPSRKSMYGRMLSRLCKKELTQPIKQIELQGVALNGSIIPMEISVSQPKGEGKIKLIIIGRDITKRREAENQIHKGIEKQNELIETQKLFANIASHEFRTPLSIIPNAVQHLERGGTPPTQEYIYSKTGRIRFAVGRMLQLMERLLSLSNIEQGTFSLDIKSVNISDLMEHVCHYHMDLSKKHNITYELTDLPDYIKADAITVEQILNNLIDNAVKYSPENGDIHLIAKGLGDYIEISIQDSGLGIDSEEIPRLFERFFRSTNSVGISGTGIGLHLVKLLAEMHEGTISVISEKGAGSTFTLRLPVSGPKITRTQTERAA